MSCNKGKLAMTEEDLERVDVANYDVSHAGVKSLKGVDWSLTYVLEEH